MGILSRIGIFEIIGEERIRKILFFIVVMILVYIF